MSILEKIKHKKDVYIYMREKAKQKKAELLPQTVKSKSADRSWHFWNGVEMTCTSVIADINEIERFAESVFSNIDIDLSALRGE